jgi:hypothetical protein
MEAISALSAARTAMVGVHGELAEAKLRLGIRTKMGGVENKPASMTVVDKADARKFG